ncbi:MAG: hypothetical protein JWO31_1981, partial [Phycisphaerales bacterium]|nr:hypothetical protein [Phycisphaerales bacterium]
QAWRDYDRLRLHGETKNAVSVPNSLLGPLWTGSEPTWAVAAAVAVGGSYPGPVPLEVYIDPGGASVEMIQAVFDALSDIQAAAGGLGLDFTPDETGVLIVEGVQA